MRNRALAVLTSSAHLKVNKKKKVVVILCKDLVRVIYWGHMLAILHSFIKVTATILCHKIRAVCERSMPCHLTDSAYSHCRECVHGIVTAELATFGGAGGLMHFLLEYSTLGRSKERSFL